jgi:hypothetical protein
MVDLTGIESILLSKSQPSSKGGRIDSTNNRCGISFIEANTPRIDNNAGYPLAESLDSTISLQV